jgi:hypothetical protein
MAYKVSHLCLSRRVSVSPHPTVVPHRCVCVSPDVPSRSSRRLARSLCRPALPAASYQLVLSEVEGLSIVKPARLGRLRRLLHCGCAIHNLPAAR